MNKIFMICVSLLCATASLVAQSGATPRALEFERADSLIIVNEDELVASLIRLVNEQEQSTTSSLGSTEELLRLQLLFNLFAPQTTTPQQAFIQPSAAPAVITPDINLQQPNPQYEARLARIETLLLQLMQGQRVAQPLQLAQPLQQSLVPAPSSTTTRTQPVEIIVPDQSGISDARLEALERRLDALRAEQQMPVVQEAAPNVMLVSPIVSPRSEAKVITDTVRISTTDIVTMPVDFKRSVYFRVGDYSLDAGARATLQEVASFLYQYPDVKVQISGFASPDGNAQRNELLAQRRRTAVELYLETEGVARSRFVSDGAQIDKSTSGAQLARRVDITLIR